MNDNNFNDQNTDQSEKQQALADILETNTAEAELSALSLIDEVREKRFFSRIGAGYALFTIISLAASFIIQFIVLALDPSFYQSTLFLNLLSPVSLYLFALPVLLLILPKDGKRPFEQRRLGFGQFLLFVIAAFGFMYIGAFIGNAVMELMSDIMNYDYSNALNSIIDQENIWITAVFTVIVAPIGEEFVFRKLIIDRLCKFGPFISIGLSALIFGLMHANFYQFFYCFALGILLGYIYYSTGRLYLTIAIHAIVNFFGSVVPTIFTPITDALFNIDPNDPNAMLSFMSEHIVGLIGMLAFEMFIFAAMICAVIFPIVFRKKLRLRAGEVALRGKQRLSVVILNFGILAMLAVYIIEFVLNLLPL